jgi:chromosome condensin MukBEF MukE localization factor
MTGRIAASTMARSVAASSAAQLARGKIQEQMRATAARLMRLGLVINVTFPFSNQNEAWENSRIIV